MTAPHADQLIEGYVARLSAAAGDLPKSARQELIDDMRSHIAEARAREPQETDAVVMNILDRLGEPAAVVADARERLGIRPPQPYRSGFLEIAAVILVPFFWPIGVILLWISPAWKVRDKIIGTLLPPGGYLGVFLFGLTVATVHSAGCPTATDPTGQGMNLCGAPSGQFPLENAVSIAGATLFCVLPLLTAAYLAVRLRWGRSRQASATA
jgi:HAAS domain-containing protein